MTDTAAKQRQAGRRAHVEAIQGRLAEMKELLAKPAVRVSGALGLGRAVTALTATVEQLTELVGNLARDIELVDDVDARLRRLEVLVAGDEQLLDDVGHGLDSVQREIVALRRQVDQLSADAP